MQFSIDLEYTPCSPQPTVPFTEMSFLRARSSWTFEIEEIGLVLVDLWNFGWEDGPVHPQLGLDLSLERGLSHAVRKRAIIEEVICPTVTTLRRCGVQILHCNHPPLLEHYPQWMHSTTEDERQALERQRARPPQERNDHPETQNTWPPPDWVQRWQDKHADEVFNTAWSTLQEGVYPQMRLPVPVQPHQSDLLIFSNAQFHRLLSERKIRVLFYMGFEATVCVQFSPYGIANMQSHGYLCIIVRDGTTTYEVAETVDGFWRTRVEVIAMEQRWGYSTSSQTLVKAVEDACHTS